MRRQGRASDDLIDRGHRRANPSRRGLPRLRGVRRCVVGGGRDRSTHGHARGHRPHGRARRRGAGRCARRMARRTPRDGALHRGSHRHDRRHRELADGRVRGSPSIRVRPDLHAERTDRGPRSRPHRAGVRTHRTPSGHRLRAIPRSGGVDGTPRRPRRGRATRARVVATFGHRAHRPDPRRTRRPGSAGHPDEFDVVAGRSRRHGPRQPSRRRRRSAPVARRRRCRRGSLGVVDARRRTDRPRPRCGDRRALGGRHR